MGAQKACDEEQECDGQRRPHERLDEHERERRGSEEAVGRGDDQWITRRTRDEGGVGAMGPLARVEPSVAREVEERGLVVAGRHARAGLFVGVHERREVHTVKASHDECQ